MSITTFAKIGAAGAALALGAHFLLSSNDPESCKQGPDGEIILTMKDGETRDVGTNSGWRVNEDRTHCSLSNGSAPPLVIDFKP